MKSIHDISDEQIADAISETRDRAAVRLNDARYAYTDKVAEINQQYADRVNEIEHNMEAELLFLFAEQDRRKVLTCYARRFNSWTQE